MPGRAFDPLPGALSERSAATLRRAQQGVIDSEVRASRRLILGAFRHRLRRDATTLAAEDFLTLADRALVHSAVVVAARGVADACHLQVRDPGSGSLHTVASHGLPPSLLEHFDADTDAVVRSARAPVLVDDVATSPVFAGRPARRVLLDAGCRAVQSYPLRDDRGGLVGVLSLHHRTSGRRPARDQLVRSVAHAVAAFPAARTDAAEHRVLPPRPSTITTFATRTVDGVVALSVHGALDALTAPDLGEHVRRELARADPPRGLVLDLRSADLIAVGGARVLLAVARMCATRAVRCDIVAAPDHQVRTLFDRLGVSAELRVVAEPDLVAHRPRW